MNYVNNALIKAVTEFPDILEFLELIDIDIDMSCESIWSKNLDKIARVNFYSYDNETYDEAFIYYKQIKIHYEFGCWKFWQMIPEKFHYPNTIFSVTSEEIKELIKMCKHKNIKELINFI